jgi:hypothetical protein
MAQEVYMNVPAVQKMANNFGTFGDILRSVSKGLHFAINALKMTAFVGAFGNFAVARWLERIQPRIDKMATKMFELKEDLNGAIAFYTTGDITGSDRFRN